MDWAPSYDADLQAAKPEACEQARVPRADENQGWEKDPQPSAEPGSDSARGDHRPQIGPDTAADGERFPPGARIRRSNDIRAMLERGKRKRTGVLEVFFAPSPASRSRLGLIVPKHGRRIVDRNRLKRRLREIGRRSVLPRLAGAGQAADILIRARRNAYEADFATLEREIHEAVEALCSPHS